MPSIDDINDVVSYNMRIFNRCGELIFETDEAVGYWDGIFNNNNVQEGVYGYTISIKDIYDNYHNFNGHICLIR